MRQEKLLGLTPFRELSPTVFLHHASLCLYLFKHGFLNDPRMAFCGVVNTKNPGKHASSCAVAQEFHEIQPGPSAERG